MTALLAAAALGAAWLTAAATGALPGGSRLDAFADVVASPYFLFPLAGEMAVLSLLSFRSLASEWRTLLLLPPGIVVLSAVAVGWPAETTVATLAASLLIVVQFTYLMLFMYRNKQLYVPVATYMVRLAGAGTVVGLGLLVWVVWHSPVVVGVAAVAEMLVFLSVAVEPPALVDEERFSWLMRPFWAFQMLCAIFLAELFLGAALDISIYGPVYMAQFPWTIVVGVPLTTAVGNAVWDGLWFVAGTAVSAWFLILMGLEMAALVVLKIRETHEKEQKWRLGLMVAVYAVAVVYIPSFWTKTPLVSNSVVASLPVIGWGMGIRTGGPFAPTVLGAIILMYASVGVLTVLFGRRALCSVMCGAALMYQSATISEMRTFNRTSRIGRLFLGSNFSTAYAVASGVALVSLFGTSFLPYLHLLPGVPTLRQQLHGGDPAVRALLRRPLVRDVRLDPVRRELQLRHDGLLPLGIVRPAVQQGDVLQAPREGQDDMPVVHDRRMREGVPDRAHRHADALPDEGGVPQREVLRRGRLRPRLPVREHVPLRRPPLAPRQVLRPAPPPRVGPAPHGGAPARRDRGVARLGERRGVVGRAVALALSRAPNGDRAPTATDAARTSPGPGRRRGRNRAGAGGGVRASSRRIPCCPRGSASSRRALARGRSRWSPRPRAPGG